MFLSMKSFSGLVMNDEGLGGVAGLDNIALPT